MKKIISLVLTACMVFALVPTISFAAVTDAQDTQAANEVLQTDGVDQGDEAEEMTDFTAAAGPWVQDSTGWRYIDPVTQQALKGKQQINGVYWYYFEETAGYMQTSWVTLPNGKRNYYDPTPGEPGLTSYGTMKTGWFTDVDGSKYYLVLTSGVPKTGWLKKDGDRYYFGSNGKMWTGWHKIDDYKYYLNPKTGKAATGWHTIDGSKYYFSDSGKMKTGWAKINGSKYYFGSNGKMVTGVKKINGSKYYFANNGKMQTGAKKISGKLYYFFSSGKAVSRKGWFKGSDGKSRYSLGTGGTVATGLKTIGGITYKFSTSTGICIANYGDKYDQKIRNTSSNTSWLVYVVKSKFQVRVYKGKKGNWSKQYTFTCALGSSKPTYSGTYTVSSKTKQHSYRLNGQDVHWNNGLNYGGSGAGFNGYVWAGKTSGNLVDGRLGGYYTGGRVRVAENNSVWLYNNIPNGTKVVIQ